MKLYTCHVDNFGCLRDLDLDFRSCLHTVQEDNGWGKSTLAAFLLVMFYGFSNEKNRSAYINERRRYAPWQQGVYGGTVTFSWKGRMLRLERVFGLKNAGEDTVVVYDAETNLAVEDLPADPGETLFAIDRESFARTVFIAQQDCGTEATSGIQAKIGHLEGEEADMADYHQVQASLKKMTDRLTPDRKTGELYRIRQEAAGLENEIARRPVCEQTLEKLETQMSRRIQEKAALQAGMDQDQEELRQLSVIRQTAEDFSLDGPEQERLKELEEIFASGVPDAGQTEEAEACLAEIRRMRSAFDREQKELYNPENRREKEQQARGGTSLVSMLVFALAASALLAFFINRAVAAGLAVLAVVIIIVVMRRDKETEKEEGPARPVVVVRQNTSPINRAVDLREKREKLKKKWLELEAAEEELLAFLRQYYPSLTEEEDLSRRLQQLQYDLSDYEALLKKQQKALAAEDSWSTYAHESRAIQGNGREETERAGSLQQPMNDLQQRILSAKDHIRKTEGEIESIQRQIDSVQEELDHAAEAEEKLAGVHVKLDETQSRYEILCSTREYLAQARTAFTARYMEPVREAFEKYYKMLTGSDAKEYQLDADLKIGIREYGLVRDPAFQSEGWQDLIGLCRRMAMIDTMYEEEKPFLLFDDPFVNLDGDKLQRALQFLKLISETYQVIYFTCHESRVP